MYPCEECCDDLFVGEFGFPFELVVHECDPVTKKITAANLAGLTVAIRFTRPDRTYVDKTATLPNGGGDGLVQYVVDNALLNQAGTWKASVKITSGASSLRYSSKREFPVLAA